MASTGFDDRRPRILCRCSRNLFRIGSRQHNRARSGLREKFGHDCRALRR
jgi:hypothetical protein